MKIMSLLVLAKECCYYSEMDTKPSPRALTDMLFAGIDWLEERHKPIKYYDSIGNEFSPASRAYNLDWDSTNYVVSQGICAGLSRKDIRELIKLIVLTMIDDDYQRIKSEKTKEKVRWLLFENYKSILLLAKRQKCHVYYVTDKHGRNKIILAKAKPTL